MKFTLVIAALFATSAIAAPCGKGHNHNDGVTTIPDQVKVPAGDNNQEQNAQIHNGNGPIKGGDANGALVGAPITVPVNVQNVDALNGVLSSVLGGNVDNSKKQEQEIEQKQKQHN